MSELPPPVVSHCTRHPDRATGRACTRCERPACPECLTPAAVGSLCADCVRRSRPDTATRVRHWNARQPILVSLVLIAMNVAVFVWVVSGDVGAAGFGSEITQREFDLALNRYVLDVTGEWYRLITSGFLHFGILHIGMNMLLLYQLGQMLEPPLGRVRFALLYTASLLGGSLGALVIQGDRGGLHGGASGAVFGLMAAAAIGLQRRGVNVFQTGIGAVLVINLVLTFTIPGISIGGHVGGAVAGALCGIVMLAPSWKPVPTWATYLTPIAVAAGAVLGSIATVG